MLSPNAAAKASTRVERKNADLGQHLARKRSQDFKSKISGWNNTGAGLAADEKEDVVVVRRLRKTGAGNESLNTANVEIVTPAEPGEAGGAAEEDTSPARLQSSTPKPKMGARQGEPKKTSREVDSERKAWVRRKSRPSADIAVDVKQATTPKKRIVSDGHWRRDRTAREEEATPETEKAKDSTPTPKPTKIRRSVVTVGLKMPPTTQDFIEEPELELTRRRPLRAPYRSGEASRDREDTRAAMPDYESSGMKVYIKRRQKSLTREQSGAQRGVTTSESSFTEASSCDRPSTATGLTIPDITPPRDMPKRPDTAPKERLRGSSLGRETTPSKSLPQSTEAEDVQPRASRTRTKTPPEQPRRSSHGKPDPARPRKIPANKEPARPKPSMFGNHIEGWLAEMSEDPFTESVDRSLTPEPLKIPARKGRALNDSRNADYEARRRTTNSRKDRAIQDLEPLDIHHQAHQSDDSPDFANQTPGTRNASTTLKRSGARRDPHSPVKDRYMRDSMEPLRSGENSTFVPRSTSLYTAAKESKDRSLTSNGNRVPPKIPAWNSRSRALPPKTFEDVPDIPEGSIFSRASDGDDSAWVGAGLKRRLTKHSDLMSVLSVTREDENGLAPARSVRARRLKPEVARLADIMNEVSADELKYQRELRTLVDGVIPVLLSYVLSKGNSTSDVPSAHNKAHDNPALTKPIVDMGIALERLKANHRRIPLHESNELLLWAQGTFAAYTDYVAAWRLGFSDIVVNLAPAQEHSAKNDSTRWDDDLPRNESGDLVDGKGERVDVAYLLKRPLVRLKSLSKAFKTINEIRPSHLAHDQFTAFQELVEKARQRVNDERARLEDEAAAAIDPTRARDPQTLAPLSGVNIDPTRCVRARDYFDMELFHSSGQQLDCKVELIARDDAPGGQTSGDVLFCEVSTTGRWLLFPPMLTSFLSARGGDKDGEIVVMLRGMLPSGNEWREMLSLHASDEQCAEWLQMLGSDPMPPRLTRQSSFNTMGARPLLTRELLAPQAEFDIPVGERAPSNAQKWDGSDVNSVVGDLPSFTQTRTKTTRYHNTALPAFDRKDNRQEHSRSGTYAGPYEVGSPYDNDQETAPRPRVLHSRSKSDWTPIVGLSSPKKEYAVWLPSSDKGDSDESADEDDRPAAQRPSLRRRTSSIPSTQLPTVNKLRKPSQQPTSSTQTPRSKLEVLTQEEPSSAPAKLQKQRPREAKEESKDESPSRHQNSRPASSSQKTGFLPSFTPAFLKRHRRSSSPLKHEYEPSTASESSSSEDFSDDDDMESVTSDSTAEEEGISVLGELRDFSKVPIPNTRDRPSLERSSQSLDGDTVNPSDSASQGPYRSVPPASAGFAKSVACLFCWSDSGSWDSIHPEECEIVVTPGLIEAFDLAQAHAVTATSEQEAMLSPSSRGVRPLVALELTPLVPLRRGTALDISIRSPPTADSVLRNSNNLMFRSRNPEECEKLYSLINRARIDNPTWIALQNARKPTPTSNWAEVMDRRNAARSNGSSWIRSLSKRGSTYRSKGTRSASIAASQSSISSMNTAFSALRRFSGGGSRFFNIAKSTIQSRDGTGSTGSDSLRSGTGTPRMTFDPAIGTPVGITNSKIRLYARETASKWRDMGAARLTILLPPRSDTFAPADSSITGVEKRVLVQDKKGQSLLDVVLRESCFERVARTGIAVEVPLEDTQFAPSTGGVTAARSKVFMLQMRSERDAAFTFSMVGKLRY